MNRQFIHSHLVRSVEVMKCLQTPGTEDLIADMIAMLEETRQNSSVAWFAGNGGKTAISSEWANDLTNGVEWTNGPIMRCDSLCDNTTMLTAIANDIDYDSLFSRQIRLYARPGDLFVGMSGSGHSKNVLRAFVEAKANGLRTVGLVGMDGGRMTRDHAGSIDCLIHIPTDYHEDGLIEDTMLMLCHLCVAYFRDQQKQLGRTET